MKTAYKTVNKQMDKIVNQNDVLKVTGQSVDLCLE